MKLTLKNNYNNSIVKRGSMVFNSSTAHPRHYQFYYDNGFKDLFETEAPKSVKPKENKDEKEKK